MIRYRRLFLLPLDVFLVAASHLLAYLLRFEGSIPEPQRAVFWTGLLVSVLVKPACFLAMGFYRRLWRYASIPDLVHIVKAVTLATVASSLLTLLATHFHGYSRSVFLLDWLLVTALLMGRSLIWRVLQEHRYSLRRSRGPRTLIVGAGMAGRMLFQEIRHNPDLSYSVLGFLDDDRAKAGANISGRPVLGTIRQLRRIALEQSVTNVIIAIPSAPARLIREVVHACQEAGLEVRTLPPITDMLDPGRLAAQLDRKSVV